MASRLRDALVRLALRLVTLYLRAAPSRRWKPKLLRFCRQQLAPMLPPFRETVLLAPGLLPPSVPVPMMQCFQLGGAHHSDVLSEWIFYTGAWQPALTAWLRRALAPGDVFVDVGANTGYFALLAAALVQDGGSVVAIEASPATHERLRTNLAPNPPCDAE